MGRCQRSRVFGGRNVCSLFGECGQGVAHQRHRAKSMSEPGMLCASKDEVAYSQLTNSSQALHFRGFYQIQNQGSWHTDETMHRISEHF